MLDGTTIIMLAIGVYIAWPFIGPFLPKFWKVEPKPFKVKE